MHCFSLLWAAVRVCRRNCSNCREVLLAPPSASCTKSGRCIAMLVTVLQVLSPTPNRFERMKSTLTLLIFALCGIGSGPQQGTYTVSVDVDVVTMNVRVTDHNANAISGLNRSDFSIYD